MNRESSARNTRTTCLSARLICTKSPGTFWNRTVRRLRLKTVIFLFRIIRNKKITVFSLKRRTVRFQNVPGDFVQIKRADKQVVLVFLAEDSRFIPDHAARRGIPEQPVCLLV